MLVDLLDGNGESPPCLAGTAEEDVEDKLVAIEEYPDKIISCSVDDPTDEEMLKNVDTYQSHMKCSFTCHKKRKIMTIKATEGHGRYDGREGEELSRVPVCRFKFPKYPMDETKVLLGFK